MSSASASKAGEPSNPLRLRLWPQSLLGRLIAATVLAVLLAQAAGLVLIAEERENFVLQSSVREWARRIVETVQMLAPLDAGERATAVAQLPGPHQAPPSLPPPPADDPPRSARNLLERGRTFVRLPVLSDFERTLSEQGTNVNSRPFSRAIGANSTAS